MSNVIERHPGYTLFLAIVTAVVTTWGILTFVLEDNKINFYKAQVESIKAETESIKSISSQYLARIEYLEKENSKLEILNSNYLTWISKSASPIPYLQKRVEDLTAENLDLVKRGGDTVRSNTNLPTTNKAARKYNITWDIKKAQAYFDDTTGITIGVKDISVLFEADLQISLPGKSVINEKVAAGKTYPFHIGKRSFQLMLIKVDYVFDHVRIQIVER